MQQIFKRLMLASLVVLLASCGESSNNTTSNDTNNNSALSVSELATGVYTVSVGEANNPTVGKYYAGANGDRLLVLNNSNEQAERIYRRLGNSPWEAAPASATSVTLLRHDATPAATVDMTNLAGDYLTQVASGVTAGFNINTTGVIAANSANCKISGQLSMGNMSNTLNLSLKTANCGSLPASSTGVLVVDSDYTPANFRLLTLSEQKVVDLWAYAE